jgi:uncharacterized protein YggE
MKTAFLFIGLLLMQVTGFAQQNTQQQRGIIVNGTAKKEIVPDEIYIEVELKEFTKDKKKSHLSKIAK